MPQFTMPADIEDDDRLRVLTHSAYAASAVRAMERPLLDDGVPLMRMAAGAVAETAERLLDDEDMDVADARIVVLAGAGDNGGDGLYAGARLAEQGATVTAIAVGRSLHESAFAALARAGGKVLVLDPQADIPGCASGFSAGEAGERFESALRLIARAHLLIDAMTGIGVNGALRGIPASIARSAGLNGTVPEQPALADYASADHRPLVVAVDAPSGVGVDDGTLPGAYIPADATVTFGAMKPCAMVPPACYAMGRLVLVDFGFDIDDVMPAVDMADDEFAGEFVRLPRLNDSKYSRGVVGLVTGSARYPGAAVLTVKGATRANVGMVRYLGPQRAQDMVLAARPEAVIGKGHVQSWVVGSGVPDAAGDPDGEDIQRETIGRLMRHYSLAQDASAGADGDGAETPYDMPPIVVDAGALDLLPERVPAHVLITPHAAELARLLSSRGESVTTDDVLAEPWRYARLAHRMTGATVLLKGAVTIVVGDDDGGDATLLCGAAPAWLSTAGAGDVLAGVLGAVMAQNSADVTGEDEPSMAEIAAAGAYLHGKAAALASDSDQTGWRTPAVYGGKRSPQLPMPGHPIIASDVVAAIPQAIEDVVR